MKIRLSLALLLPAAAVPAAAAPPPAGEPIHLSELRDLPEQELIRRVFGPVNPFPYLSPRRIPVTAALHGYANLWFWTRPRAGGHAGICRTDRLIVTFERAPLDPGPRDDPGMVPAAFDMQSYFIVENRKEAFGPYSPKERGRYALDEACAQLDPRRDGIAADSAYQLIRAMELTRNLGEAARAGKRVPPLDCTFLHGSGPAPGDQAACLAELRDLREESVHWVKDCPPRREAPGGCIQVMTWDRLIQYDLSVGGEPIRIVLEALQDTSSIE